uniref:Methenyltetrahydrofolate cyclohydrolase n=2 Tax=Ditylum brightwellii TaxID=49249 RepID=A0A7S1ZWN3_9STRA|mmetsp:Transcript_39882/g.59891  ORF Transcript_39882/g.59891 Transcript_39882/m.59891 type:complete len:387 (+) Transcript_39882:142-1302(+)
MSSTTTPTTTVTIPSENKGTKVDVTAIAKPFREDIQRRVADLEKAGLEPPLLVGLLANTDPAARKYAEWTGKACRADGLRYELRLIDSPIDVENALNSANDDPAVHGIIVYYPIFGQVESFSGTSQDDYLRDTISYKCDVEGLCHTYRTNLYRNTRFLDYPTKNLKCVLPCTALSVVKILESIPNCYDKSKPIGRHMEGQVVTVINRSEVVGRPLAAMLANDGADVYSVDINSIYLFRAGGRLEKVSEDETPESVVRKSTVVIAGVPTKSYKLPTEWIQPNTTVVNVASFKNVDEESLLQVPGVTYVPMVGKVTVAMLERNLMRLYENFHRPKLLQYQQPKEEEKKEETQAVVVAPSLSSEPWYGSPIQLYNAIALTVLIALTLRK